MPSTTCPVCKKRYFDFERHVCGTAYEVRAEDNEEEIFHSTSDDLEDVAAEYMEHVFYNWDCPDSLDIEVRLEYDDEWKKFNVEVEPVPTFNPTEYGKFTCVDCKTEFESLQYAPERCEKCNRVHREQEYQRWKKEEAAQK